MALADLGTQFSPRKVSVAIVGLGAYRVGFVELGATVGPQEDPIGGRLAWALPQPERAGP